MGYEACAALDRLDAGQALASVKPVGHWGAYLRWREWRSYGVPVRGR